MFGFGRYGMGTNDPNPISFEPKSSTSRKMDKIEDEKIQFILAKEKAEKRYKRESEDKIRWAKYEESEKKDPKEKCAHCCIYFSEDKWAAGGHFPQECYICEKKYVSYCRGCEGKCIKGCKRSFCVECWEKVHICCENCSLKSHASALTCAFCKDCLYVCEGCNNGFCDNHLGDFKHCEKCGKYACPECNGEYNSWGSKDSDYEEERACCAEGKRRKLTPEEEKQYEEWRKEVTKFNHRSIKENRKRIKKFKKQIKKEKFVSQKDSDVVSMLKKEYVESKKSCFVCEKTNNGKLKKCSSCKAIYYCGRKCQIKDWKRHKKECGT